MRPWAWVRRLLASVVTVAFALTLFAAPAFAASKSFSGGSRSFSTPKVSTPKTTAPKSYSTPKTTTAPSTPKTTAPATPPKSYSSTDKSYSSTDKSYSGSDRSYSSTNKSFSSTKPTPAPAPTYETSKTQYPTRPPVVVYAPSSPYPPTYWHDYYYGMPWYWRMWHRPVYYGSSWGINWIAVIAFGVGIWVLLGVISAYATRRRRNS